ncbi:UNVERIFIED_CONTAM: Fatty acid desaturase 4, chloroplastic [Sesamum radiatum]|uniref:Fatty acid desaturase 4, chloroplastic n=1 Tax=Sesamum radiatum TaxID=300843 RepID=A0AAW2K871_SESRA
MAAVRELQRQKSAKNNPKQYENQESWQISTWAHRACFAGGCATVLISLLKSLLLTAGGSRPWLEPMIAALIGYVAADLVTGIYHWAIDNYGGAETPVFGSQIEAFLSHHQHPSAITRRQLANNLYIPSAAVTVVFTPLNVVSADPALLGFAGVFAGCIMFSQQFHAWAHTPKGKLPPLVVAIQDAGIIVGRAQHAAHHRSPYNSNYCIVSGVWNRFLDRSKFFVAAEVAVFRVVGVRPRSWSEPNSVRKLQEAAHQLSERD